MRSAYTTILLMEGSFFHGHTVSMDTQQTEPDAYASYRRTLRQEIARSRRLGVFTNIEYAWESLDSFIDIYAETMLRNGASQYYHFDHEYFERLKKATRDNAFLILARLDRRIIAGCVILAYDRMLHVHLGGTRTEFLKLSPFKIIFDDLRIWARDHGHFVVHLGGGRGSDDRDSLFFFKSEFSKGRHEFYTGHWILDSEAYRQLCQSRDPDALDPDIEMVESGFFPAYRAPYSKRHSQSGYTKHVRDINNS